MPKLGGSGCIRLTKAKDGNCEAIVDHVPIVHVPKMEPNILSRFPSLFQVEYMSDIQQTFQFILQRDHDQIDDLSASMGYNSTAEKEFFIGENPFSCSDFDY